MGKGNNNPIEGIELLRKHIAELEKAVQIATEDKELGENIIDALRDPLIIMDAEFRLLSVNKSFYDTFKVGTDETLGKSIYDLGNKQWDMPKLRTLLEEILLYNASIDNYVFEHDFPSIGRRLMILNARRIPRPPAKPRIILLVMEDITDIQMTKLSFEKILEIGIFSEARKEGEVAIKQKEAIIKEKSIIISELKKEIDALLARLNERLKYNK